MIRRLVAIYMAFALVAGPSLCCCTTGFVASAPSHGAAPAEPSPVRTPPCCCKHATSGAETVAGATCDRPAAGDTSPAVPKPGEHRCPCKDEGGKQTPDTTSPVASAAQDAARLLTADLPSTVALTANLPADFGLDSTGGHSPPDQRLTSWRLLNAPHMLRC